MTKNKGNRKVFRLEKSNLLLILTRHTDLEHSIDLRPMEEEDREEYFSMRDDTWELAQGLLKVVDEEVRVEIVETLLQKLRSGSRTSYFEAGLFTNLYGHGIVYAGDDGYTHLNINELEEDFRVNLVRW